MSWTSSDLAFATSSGSKCSPGSVVVKPFFEFRVTDVLNIRVGHQACDVQFVFLDLSAVQTIHFHADVSSFVGLRASSRESPPSAHSDWPAASSFYCSTFLLFLSSSSCRSNALATCRSNFSRPSCTSRCPISSYTPRSVPGGGPTDDLTCIPGTSPRTNCSMSFFLMKMLQGIDSWAVSLPFDILIVFVECFFGYLQLRERLPVCLVVVLAHPPQCSGDQLHGLRVPAVLG